jgi:DNA-binding beta-propeller fold protein YncE
VAVVDAASLDILRVIPLGPIPKGIAISPDGRYVALAQWGDNCVTLIDVSSGDPGSFAYAAVIPVGGRLDMDSIPDGADRDKVCGQCLRGMAFSPDGKVLFVGRLGGGGLAVIDLPPGKRPSYRGTLHDVPRTPRDLRVSPDGRWLYLSASVSGVVARARLSELAAARGAGRLALPPGSAGFRTVAVGTGARSLALTGDGALLFVAVNNGSEIVAVRTADLRVVGRAAAPPYPVGLDVSPDGRRLWVASQGRDGRGGNVVSIYDVRERQVPLVAASRPPE